MRITRASEIWNTIVRYFDRSIYDNKDIHHFDPISDLLPDKSILIV